MERIKELFKKLDSASVELSEYIGEKIVSDSEQVDVGLLSDAIDRLRTEVLARIRDYIKQLSSAEKVDEISLEQMHREYNLRVMEAKLTSVPADNYRFSRNLRIEKYTAILNLCASMIGHIGNDDLTLKLVDFVDTIHEEIAVEVEEAFYAAQKPIKEDEASEKAFL